MLRMLENVALSAPELAIGHIVDGRSEIHELLNHGGPVASSLCLGPALAGWRLRPEKGPTGRAAPLDHNPVAGVDGTQAAPAVGDADESRVFVGRGRDSAATDADLGIGIVDVRRRGTARMCGHLLFSVRLKI